MDVNAVLRHYDEKDREANANAMSGAKAMGGPKVPALGLLTQTALQSPLVHWILPVRLRHKHSSDVAFIGVSEAIDLMHCSVFWKYLYSALTVYTGQLCSD